VVKKKVLKPKKAKKNGKTSDLSPQDNQEDRFDFGGLPKMNLKKNLGCG
jgi:hypothetical protein